jgi:hypothetical protein
VLFGIIFIKVGGKMTRIEDLITNCINNKSLHNYYGKVTEINSGDSEFTCIKIDLKFIPTSAAKGNSALNTKCLKTSFYSNHVEFCVKAMCWGDICGVLANLIY